MVKLPGICFWLSSSMVRVQGWLGQRMTLKKVQTVGVTRMFCCTHSPCVTCFLYSDVSGGTAKLYQRKVGVCEGNVSFNKLQIWWLWNIVLKWSLHGPKFQ